MHETAHLVADDVVGEIARGRAKAVALFAPLCARLKGIEPAAPCSRPKRFVLQTGGYRQMKRLERERHRMAIEWHGQFESEIHRVIGATADEPALEFRVRRRSEQHLTQVRRTDDG